MEALSVELASPEVSVPVMGVDDDRVASLLEKLSGVRQEGESQWSARCPAHEDADPSLSIGVGNDGRVLLNCFSGCKLDRICSALEVEVRDLFPEARQRSRSFTGRFITLEDLAKAKGLPEDYLAGLGLSDTDQGVAMPYTDEQGKVLLTRHRQYLEGPIRVKHPKGVRLSVYGLERLARLDKSADLFFVEGESDCWTLWYKGYNALGFPGNGSPKSLLRREHVEGRSRVHIVQEGDQGGSAFVANCIAALSACGYEGEARIVRMDTHTKDPNALFTRNAELFSQSFDRLVDRASIRKLKTTWESAKVLLPGIVTAHDMCSSAPHEPDWIVEGILAKGTITDLVAAPKVGKTTLAGALCASVVSGLPFLGRNTRFTRILYLTEQNGSTFSFLLSSSGLSESTDLAVVTQAETAGLKWAEVVVKVVEIAEQEGVELVVVDTLPAFAGLFGEEENQSGAAYGVMNPLKEAANKGLAILTVRHSSKFANGSNPASAGRGSTAFAASADIIFSYDYYARRSKRILRGLGRLPEIPSELILEKVDGAFRISDKDRSSHGKKEDDEVETVLVGLALERQEPLPSAAFIEAAKGICKKTKVNGTLASLVKEGVFKPEKRKGKGNPVYYHLSLDHPKVQKIRQNRSSDSISSSLRTGGGGIQRGEGDHSATN